MTTAPYSTLPAYEQDASAISATNADITMDAPSKQTSNGYWELLPGLSDSM
jgi:hypothetical protein